MSLQQWQTSQANPELVVNQNFNVLAALAVYGRDPTSTTGLTWGYIGGWWGGEEIAAGTVTLAANETNYLVVEKSTGDVYVSTSDTDWENTEDFVRVYRLTTGATTVTAIADFRMGPNGLFTFGSNGGGGGGGGGGGDPLFSSVSSLLSFDGENGSTVFTDTGPNPKTYTRTGDTVISTAQSVFGGSSGSFPGFSNFLSTPNNADFNFGASDFTIEMFFRLTNVATLESGLRVSALVAKDVSGDRSYIFGMNSTDGTNNNRIYAEFTMSNGSTISMNLTVTTNLNQWYHIAVQRSGNRFNAYLDGVFAGESSTTDLALRDSSSDLRIGRWGLSGSLVGQMRGFIDELRITKGHARYTENFTPPSAPFPTS